SRTIKKRLAQITLELLHLHTHRTGRDIHQPRAAHERTALQHRLQRSEGFDLHQILLSNSSNNIAILDEATSVHWLPLILTFFGDAHDRHRFRPAPFTLDRRTGATGRLMDFAPDRR